MSLRLARNATIALVLALIPGSSAELSPGLSHPNQFYYWPPPRTLADPRLETERKASVSWEVRTGPQRRVVDLVCLVPDVPTFLEALSDWDDNHFFPILIDDSELSFKFLRAFRPARIVRFPGQGQSVASDKLWSRAVNAVANSWVRSSVGERRKFRGDAVPKDLGPTPPGVVVSEPGSVTLAGAVALAAGRFQPLLRWEPGRRLGDRLEQEEALRLVHDLEARIGDRIPHDGVLGDDCDFITLAGDYPYRYRTPSGENAFDDLLARSPISMRRWAYAGRLVGSATASVYDAMCSLFLEPDSALLVNSYRQTQAPWSEYKMDAAASALDPFLKVTERSGERGASLEGWHRTFDPINRHGLVMITSSGYPTQFWLRNSVGLTGDVPWSVPAVVWQLHSHSAADPTDPSTLAGRWLANGAYIYVGAMNEPYMQSFRPPGLIASLVADRLPFGAAVRASIEESFGYPWRIVYLGDPLYRVIGLGEKTPRVGWNTVAGWPDVKTGPLPSESSSDDAKLDWAIDAALSQLVRQAKATEASSLGSLLLSIRRERLAPSRLARYDNLVADLLDQPEHHDAVRQKLDLLAPGTLTPILAHRLEADRMADLHRALARDDLPAAASAWDELIRSDSTPELKAAITTRVGAIALTPERLRMWRNQLRTTLQAARASSSAPTIQEELRRVEERLGL